MKRSFTLEYWRDGSWYVGRLRQVPGVFSQGGTLDELKANITDAYAEMVKDQEDVGTGANPTPPAVARS